MFNQKFRRDYRLQKYKFFLYYGYFSKILNQSYNSTGDTRVLQKTSEPEKRSLRQNV
jgi:hypothetical protein